MPTTYHRFPDQCPRYVAMPQVRDRLFHQSKAAAEMWVELFHSVETFCMFIGYPRSGHSLIGALLDAHPEMVIAHECDALAFFANGFDQGQVFAMLIENARAFGRAGRRWNEFDYTVTGQWQGRFSRLRVIGDKKGGTTTRRMLEHPGSLELLQRAVTVPTRFIHVIRNPFDNIATMVRRNGRPLENELPLYFRYAKVNCAAIATIGRDKVLDLFHEDFVARPRDGLAEVCGFLGVEAPNAYLDACAAIVFDSPRKSRSRITWPAEAIEKVHGEMARFPHLDRYRQD